MFIVPLAERIQKIAIPSFTGKIMAGYSQTELLFELLFYWHFGWLLEQVGNF